MMLEKIPLEEEPQSPLPCCWPCPIPPRTRATPNQGAETSPKTTLQGPVSSLTNHLDVQSSLVLCSVYPHSELVLARISALCLADVEDGVLVRVADIDVAGVQGLATLGPDHLGLWLSLEQPAQAH